MTTTTADQIGEFGAEGSAPEAVVRRFLAALEARDLETARDCLAPEATMTFPGPTRFTRLEELVAWSKPRYNWVKKRIDAVDVAGGVVHCHGTLYGEWLDGTPFDGIRFIDRFEIAQGRITRQDVWNDLALVMAER
jgi:ketosteroid isomerase-like protein